MAPAPVVRADAGPPARSARGPRPERRRAGLARRDARRDARGAARGAARGERAVSGVYLALVHHPVVDRAGDVITTAVTNLDVHDIARSARTYDLAGYYVVTPIEAQHRLVDRILGHWRDGAG
ncbi:MAG TPA: hypothetical protein DEF51_07890, partial [Myxococcales bacterium]|nr:hypothetical protein [Myxococcales bacterium]